MNPWPVHRLARVDSTMLQARALADAGAPEGTTVLADAQSAGRGRRGRTWVSPPGGGVWMTTVLRPGAGTGLQGLALVAGVAVWRAVQSLCPDVDVRLKWPNDVWVHERKLAGILLEADHVHSAPVVLVGLGVNVLPAAQLGLPPEVAQHSIGLQELTDAPVRRDAAFAAIHQALHAAYAQWRSHGLGPILQAWTVADALRGRQVRAEGPEGPVTGVASGLGPAGELRLVHDDGTQRLVQTGEVQTVRPVGFSESGREPNANETGHPTAGVGERATTRAPAGRLLG